MRITNILIVFLAITRIVSQSVNYLYLLALTDTKYECNIAGCSPPITITISKLQDCEIACLQYEQCRTITFNSNTNHCEISVDIPSQLGNLLAHIGSTTMIVNDERKLNACKWKILFYIYDIDSLFFIFLAMKNTTITST